MGNRVPKNFKSQGVTFQNRFRIGDFRIMMGDAGAFVALFRFH